MFSIKLASDFLSNMGVRYVAYRTIYTLSTKLGILKRKFPTHFPTVSFITLQDWRKFPPPFFFLGKNIPCLKRSPSESLKQRYEEILNGTFTFFNKLKFQMPPEMGWHVNPDSGYCYNAKTHWTEIKDFSKEAGDIKFVWEKARFAFLYDIIRYDYHFEEDCSDFVFRQIESFIDNNPINRGPHYKCSQEISLRILNWTFAIYYYRDSEHLTEELFLKILNSIYAQLHHVYNNINFSRISVRNNHAITETLTLFLSGLLFPFFPKVSEWSRKGKKWFEREIEYQIYQDGTFLQFSMNYHRVVVQLLTWGIRLAQLYGERFSSIVYERAEKTLSFFDVCIDPITGMVPNYGSNDGALFFKLNDDDFRKYTSQLNDLRAALFSSISRNEESVHWYGHTDLYVMERPVHGTFSFDEGGYYILQEGDAKTFIRCGAYKDRPFQSDNLHLDIWAKGFNYLWDTGTYKYNTDERYIRYFNGVEGHNTVSVSGKDQMLKGKRFIWYYWVKKASAKWTDNSDNVVFKGEIDAFRHLNGGYKHIRTILKPKNKLQWTVLDEIKHDRKEDLVLFFHINPEIEHEITLTCWDENGKLLNPIREEKLYSGYYGQLEMSIRYKFQTNTNLFKTKIEISG